MRMGRELVIAVIGICMSSCSSSSNVHDLAQTALMRMGGAERVRAVRSIVMRGGTGSRSRLGQIVKTGGGDPRATLANVTETLDLAGGRAALDYEISASGFTQHRQEILTKQGDHAIGLENVGTRPLAVVSPSGLFSWGTQNSPVMALRRNVIRVALAAAGADASQIPASREL